MLRTLFVLGLFVWYLGERWTDKSVPWHYPFVMTLATTPLFVSCGFALRSLFRSWSSEEKWLLLTVILPLIVFAIPGVPVYDGVLPQSAISAC